MSISKYQVFLKTVSCGSFSKAAEAMNFTQSGISHAINSLENELGVKLLSRNRGGVVLLFALGAGIGSVATLHWGPGTIWLSCGLLTISFLIMFIHDEEQKLNEY